MNVATKALHLTPECDRLVAVSGESQRIGAFFAWLTHDRDPQIELCERADRGDQLWPVSRSIEQLLAEYFEIDLDKVEAERRMLLSAVRLDHTLTEEPHDG